MEDGALLTFSRSDGLLRARAKGSWTRDNASALEANLARLTLASADVRGVAIDMAEVTAFDTFGAWLVERLRRDLTAGDRKLQIVGITPGNRSLLDEMADLNREAAASGQTGRRHLAALMRRRIFLALCAGKW